MRLLLALEQYYLLSMNPGNNDLKVAAASPGGMAVAERNRELNREGVYVYLDNVLLGVFPATFEGPGNFKESMKISNNVIVRALLPDQLLYGKFLITKIPLALPAVPTMTTDELQTALSTAAIASKSKQTAGLKAKPVDLIRLSNNQKLNFKSVTAAAKFITEDTGKNVSKNVLSAAVKSGRPVQGFTVIYITTPGLMAERSNALSLKLSTPQ